MLNWNFLLTQVSNILGLAVSMTPINSAFRIFTLFDPDISCSFKLYNVLTMSINMAPYLTYIHSWCYLACFLSSTLWTFFLKARGNKANPRKITTVQHYSSTKHTSNQFETSHSYRNKTTIECMFHTSQHRLKSKVTVFSIYKLMWNWCSDVTTSLREQNQIPVTYSHKWKDSTRKICAIHSLHQCTYLANILHSIIQDSL